MLAEKIFEVLFWTFSLFGLFCALKMACGYYLIRKTKALKAEIVIKFKNDEDVIENTVRLIAEEILFTSQERIFSGLTAVDMGSNDSSREILTNLQKEYPFLKIADGV